MEIDGSLCGFLCGWFKSINSAFMHPCISLYVYDLCFNLWSLLLYWGSFNFRHPIYWASLVGIFCGHLLAFEWHFAMPLGTAPRGLSPFFYFTFCWELVLRKFCCSWSFYWAFTLRSLSLLFDIVGLVCNLRFILYSGFCVVIAVHDFLLICIKIMCPSFILDLAFIFSNIYILYHFCIQHIRLWLIKIS